MPAREVASAPLAGHVKLKLIQELARDEVRRVELARRYGVTGAAISNFAKKHAEAIAAAKQRIDDEFAGMWIVQKKSRLAELEQDVDNINGSETARKEAVTAALGDTLDVQAAIAESEGLKPDPVLLRVKHKALRQAAEELGQLPARVTVEIGDTHVRHEIVGVDLDEV